MGQRTVFHDDLDDSEGDVATYHFAFGVKDQTETWEIDLGAANAARLREALQPFIDKARKPEDDEVSTPASRRTTGSRRANNYPVYDRADFKGWAEKNNVSVPERGRPKLADVLAFVAQR
jgi:hypothetical protein